MSQPPPAPGDALDALDIPDDARAVLRALRAGASEALGPNLVGLYLTGSLALGDFDPETSDVDFLAVTERPVDDEHVAKLRAVHDGIARLPTRLARYLEGAYINRAALFSYGPEERWHLGFDGDGTGLVWRDLGASWVIQRWIVREHGLALSGPPAAGLVAPISRDELRAVVLGLLTSHWSHRGSLGDGHPENRWLLPLNYQAYVVETMCRALYTLRHDTLPTKPQAVHWAQTCLPEPWLILLQRSRGWRTDETRNSGTLAEVLAFVRWAATDGQSWAARQ